MPLHVSYRHLANIVVSVTLIDKWQIRQTPFPCCRPPIKQLVGSKAGADPSPLGHSHRVAMRPAARSVERGNPFKREDRGFLQPRRHIPEPEMDDYRDENIIEEVGLEENADVDIGTDSF